MLLIFFIFLTHSLLIGVVWGVVVGSIYLLFKRDIRGAIVVGICVLSHWFLDLVVHVPDLPLTPFGKVKMGLGLWNHVAITLAVETILFLTGTYIYATFTKAKNKIGKWGLWALVILLLVIHLANTFGPTPSDSITQLFVTFVTMIALIVSLAYWVDNNRNIA